MKNMPALDPALQSSTCVPKINENYTNQVTGTQELLSDSTNQSLKSSILQ